MGRLDPGTSRGPMINSISKPWRIVALSLAVLTGAHASETPSVSSNASSSRPVELDGMQDYAVVSATHPFLMKDRAAIAQILSFLESGCFSHDDSDADKNIPGRCAQ